MMFSEMYTFTQDGQGDRHSVPVTVCSSVLLISFNTWLPALTAVVPWYLTCHYSASVICTWHNKRSSISLPTFDLLLHQQHLQRIQMFSRQFPPAVAQCLLVGIVLGFFFVSSEQQILSCLFSLRITPYFFASIFASILTNLLVPVVEK